ncbi:hypothetical protein TcCL_NonESM11368, partial [Trypanosoma cruzi]
EVLDWRPGGQKYPSLMRVGRAMQCSCRGAALPVFGGEWEPDTVRSPRRCGAKRSVDAPNQKGLHGVLGRTSLCAQPQPMAAWHGLLWCLCEEFCCFLNFGTGRWCIGVF